MTYIQNSWGNNNSTYINKIRNKLEFDKLSMNEIEKLKKKIAQLERGVKYFSSRHVVSGLVLAQLANIPEVLSRKLGNQYQTTVTPIIQNHKFNGLDDVINNEVLLSTQKQNSSKNINNLEENKSNFSPKKKIKTFVKSFSSKRKEEVSSLFNLSKKEAYTTIKHYVIPEKRINIDSLAQKDVDTKIIENNFNKTKLEESKPSFFSWFW